MSYVDTREDWNRKWAECIVGLKPNADGPIIPAKVLGFANNRRDAASNWSLDTDDYYLPDNTREILVLLSLFESHASYHSPNVLTNVGNEQIIWKYPNVGMINWKDTVIHVNRRNRPSHKFAEGISPNNAYLQDICASSRELLGKMPSEIRFNKEIYDRIFNPNYPTFNDAVKRVFGCEALAVAFSEHHAIGYYFKNNSFHVFRNGHMIGEVKPEVIVTLPRSLAEFRHELEYYGIHVEV
jgi:hypothetical protein